MSYHSQTKEV